MSSHALFPGRFAVRILLAAVLALAGNASAEQPILAFTAIPDQDVTRLRERFGRVAEYLQAELGVPVRYVPVKSYAAAVTAFRNDQVQLAWFGGLSGVRARLLVPGSRAIAQGASDRRFRTYLIAHASTGLTEDEGFPDGIEGLTFSFGSKGSTSGRLMPEHYIREHFGRSPGEVFSRVGFSGNHSRTIDLVTTGAYRVGAVNYKVWETEQAAGEIDSESVRVIWRSPNYPDYHWTLRAGVDERFSDGFGAKVRQALLDVEDPRILEAFSRERFVPASNDDYRTILEVGREIGLIPR